MTPTLCTIDKNNFISREKLYNEEVKQWKKIETVFHSYYNAIFYTSNEDNKKKNPGIIFCENQLLLI